MKKLFLFLFFLPLIDTVCGQTAKHDIYSNANYFTDLTFSELRDGVRARDIKKITNPLLRNAASAMLSDKYDCPYRVSIYNALPSPDEQEKTLMLGKKSFSKYDNITGMYLQAGENIVLVGDTYGRDISLLAPNLTRKPGPDVEDPAKDPQGWRLHKKEFPLTEGVNIINLDYPCNVYISYFDDDSQIAPPIKIHFLTGEVNGYFDTARGDTNEDWDRLLDNAVSEIMDLRGRYMHAALPVEHLKENASGRGVELLDIYDEMLHNHYTILGLVKYNRLPKNRIFARVNYNYYMFRDGDGVAYLGNAGTMKMVTDPDQVRKDGWGFAHEAGHALQMPEITWRGMIEVSVNIFSNYSLMALGMEDRLKSGGNYESARENIIDKGISYLEHRKPMDRLVPFWQLHTYFTRNGFPDFYPDLFEIFRTDPNHDAVVASSSQKTPDGHLVEINRQFHFIKTVCDMTKTDLTDFFEKWGFFKTGILEVEEYGKVTYNVTPEMVNEVKGYIASKNYPKPPIDLTMIQ